MKEFKIVIVGPRESGYYYPKILPAYIRLIDVLHGRDQEVDTFTFYHNGAKGIQEVIGCVNTTRPSLLARGISVQTRQKKMDAILHGKKTEEVWVKENIVGADAILMVNNGALPAGVLKTVRNSKIYTMEVEI